MVKYFAAWYFKNQIQKLPVFMSFINEIDN